MEIWQSQSSTLREPVELYQGSGAGPGMAVGTMGRERSFSLSCVSAGNSAVGQQINSQQHQRTYQQEVLARRIPGQLFGLCGLIRPNALSVIVGRDLVSRLPGRASRIDLIRLALAIA